MANKSLIKNVRITQAGAAHNCKSNKKHRLSKGEYRLTVKEGQTSSNYCLACGRKFIEGSIVRLNGLMDELPD